MNDQGQITAALELIEQFGHIEGDQYSKWVIDQVARVLLGNEYQDWRVQMADAVDGKATYDYNEGIAP